MAKKTILAAAFCVLVQAGVVFGDSATQIRYTTTDLGSGRWQYEYEVTNLSLGQILEEFTVWFESDLYENLAVVSVPPTALWRGTVWQPDPILATDGGYNAKNVLEGAGIPEDETLGGFAVSFDWLATGTPDSQFYEVIDFVTSDVIDSGYTVPEPATLCLLGLGVVLLRKRTQS